MIESASGFSIGSSDAIDERLVLTKEQMVDANDNVFPPVYFAVCKDDGYLYLYNKDNTPTTETGKFTKVGSLNDFTDAETVSQLNKMLVQQDGVWKTTTLEDAIKAVAQTSLTGDTGLPVSDTTIKAAMGAEDGFATLDANGRIPSSQLPTSAIEIVGQLDTANNHTLPDIADYESGDQLIVVTAGFVNQSTAFTLEAGKKLTEMEVTQANALIQYGYVFTLSADSVLGTVKSFATTKVTLSDDTEIELPYASDLSATSTPDTVKVDCTEGDYFMVIDGHWIHMSNTGAVTSVNGKTGAVTIPFELVNPITANVTVGGVDSGVTIPAKTSFEDLFNSILVKYIKPTVTLKLSVASLRAKWNPVSSVTLTTTTTKGTSDISSIELKAGDTVIETQTAAGTYDYVADISTKTTFTATVKDTKDKTGTASASIDFVIPFYHGVSNSTSIADPTTLTEDISAKGNKTYKYTANEQYIYVAYDYSYGALTSILDSSGFENKANFTDLGKVTVTKNGSDYDLRVYRTSSVQTQTNFPLTFKF